MTRFHTVWPDLENTSRYVQWPLLLVVSGLLIFILEYIHIPAALLMGPMIAAIIVATSNGNISIPKPFFVAAQGIVGCMIAQTITHNIITEILADWPLFIGGVLSVVIISNFIGYILAKKQILPGTTAVWGAAPGGASVMVIMAESYGADERLVAVMQYLRVVLVAGLASLLARIIAPDAIAAIQIDWFPNIDLTWFSVTLVIALFFSVGSKYLGIPAGGILIPFLVTVTLQYFNLITVVLPPWLLAISYTIIGWTIGLRFTRKILSYALKALPVLFCTTLLLIFLCSLFALVMSYLTQYDLLTTYLATSPGGADSVAIIASSTATAINVPFVMAFQITRFMVVTVTGPFLSRFIASRIGLPPAKTS